MGIGLGIGVVVAFRDLRGWARGSEVAETVASIAAALIVRQIALDVVVVGIDRGVNIESLGRRGGCVDR